MKISVIPFLSTIFFKVFITSSWSGVIYERAKEIIKQFPNAYIEYIPSDNGFHILMKYTGIYDKKNYYIKHDGIEFTVHYLQPNI